MSKKTTVPRAGRPVSLRLPEDIFVALEEIKTRDGILITEQVRRALAAWVKERLPERGKR